MRPSEQVMPGVPSVVPQVSEQSAVAAQVTVQSPSHLMSQLAVSSQDTVLEAPRLILQVDWSLQVADEWSPALRSQFDVAVQVIALFGPPLPLHSDVSTQSSVSAPFELPLHFAAELQSSAQALSPHSAWQSAPALQVHDVSAHVQPAPVHVGAEAESSSPHAPTSRRESASKITTGIDRFGIKASGPP